MVGEREVQRGRGRRGVGRSPGREGLEEREEEDKEWKRVRERDGARDRD